MKESDDQNMPRIVVPTEIAKTAMQLPNKPGVTNRFGAEPVDAPPRGFETEDVAEVVGLTVTVGNAVVAIGVSEVVATGTIVGVVIGVAAEVEASGGEAGEELVGEVVGEPAAVEVENVAEGAAGVDVFVLEDDVVPDPGARHFGLLLLSL